MNTPVTFELAKLLKEKGFNNITPHKLSKPYYNHLGELNGDVSEYLKAYVHKQDTSNFHIIDAPTVIDVVIWLYEKHGIWIEVRRTSYPIIGIRFQSYINEKPSTGDLGGYVSQEEPTDAYQAAIGYTLTNLI